MLKDRRSSWQGHLEEPGATGPSWSWITEVMEVLLTTMGGLGGEKYPGFSLLPLQPPSNVTQWQIQLEAS